MKELLVGLLAIVVGIAMLLLYGLIFYIGLPVIGVDVTYGQSVIIVVLVSTVGALFNSTIKTKGDE